MFHGVFSLRTSVFILFILFGTIVYGQKKLVKHWDTSGIDTLRIDANEVFNISLIAIKGDKITLEASVEGELFEQTLVNAIQQDKSLNISTDLTPYFTPENDKLAAHKVMSLEYTMYVPEQLAVVIHSKLGSVSSKGPFRFLDIALDQGRCEVLKFKGKARLYTVKGDINVETTVDHSALAKSKYGSVQSAFMPYGDIQIEAESTYGEIRLYRTQ